MERSNPLLRSSALRSLGIALLALLIASPALAITLTPLDRGWFNSTGAHTAGQNNTFTGEFNSNEYRSFYSFDVNNVGGNWGAATISFTPDLYYNGDATETFEIYAVTSSAAAVSAGYSSGDLAGQAIFNDLGTGTLYGSFTLTAADLNNPVLVSLNGAAVADINAARGSQWIFGVRHATGNGGNQGARFGTDAQWDGGATNSVNVPEPAIGALLGSGLIAFGISRRRARA